MRRAPRFGRFHIRSNERENSLRLAHPQLLYRAALCAYVGEQREVAREALSRLRPTALSSAQRARVAVLARSLR